MLKERTHDYLKYWRVIRYWVKSQHKVSQADLDIILFLYSEKYFSRVKFQEFNELVSWDRKRFSKLVTNGWVEVFRKGGDGLKELYQLSFKGIRLVTNVYQILDGKEIPTNSSSVAPMFAKNVSYNDKVYRNMLKRMTAEWRANVYVKPKD
jgi:hypothetical protein